MEAQRLDLPIGGMHCAGCVARVEKILQSLSGVQAAQVNLATETVTLHYEPATLRLDQAESGKLPYPAVPPGLLAWGAVAEGSAVALEKCVSSQRGQFEN